MTYELEEKGYEEAGETGPKEEEGKGISSERDLARVSGPAAGQLPGGLIAW